jgi:hypothetical protein
MQEASAQAKTLVRDTLQRDLEGQIDETHQKKEEEHLDYKMRVSTAFEEIAERFPRKRFLNRSQRKEIMDQIKEQANEKTMKETEEKERFREECINRNKYLNEMEDVIRQNETSGKLADRDLMRTVWAS